MNKHILSVAVVFAGMVYGGLVAREGEGAPEKPTKLSQFEIINRKGYKTHGGALIKPGSKKGSILFINQQKRVTDSPLLEVADRLSRQTRIELRAVNVDKLPVAKESLGKVGATFGVFVVDESDAPALLVAPEERWAKVNVARLALGVGGEEVKGAFLATRVRKELVRAVVMLCGGFSSQYDNNVLSANSIEQLDMVDDGLPLDLVMRMSKYLENAGVTPVRISTYRSACREGWAPAPTNEVQRAIWNKVHEIPSKPIKIEKK